MCSIRVLFAYINFDCCVSRMTANSLRALDGFVSLVTDEENGYQEIVTIATSLLSSPLPQQVQEQAKILLASLHPTKNAYNNHKVRPACFGRLY
jgi:hypothetical protein